jgi:hypothetical protein
VRKTAQEEVKVSENEQAVTLTASGISVSVGKNTGIITQLRYASACLCPSKTARFWFRVLSRTFLQRVPGLKHFARMTVMWWKPPLGPDEVCSLEDVSFGLD